MNRFSEHGTRAEPHDLTFLAGTPYVYHCHHFNLFHDQTIDDVLGEEAGFELRMRSSRDNFKPLLESLFARMSAWTVPEKIVLAQELFASMGQGRLSFEGEGATLTATGEHLHYGFAWREKYGARVRRIDPTDAVASGFVAALAQITSPDDAAFTGRERECVAMRASACRIVVEKDARPAGAVVREPEIVKHLGKSEGGLDEAEISGIAAGLSGFMKPVAGDARGLVDAFGVLVTQHLSGYYNETAFAAVRHVEAISPNVAAACEDLLREAGHVCVFNTFGNILLSPEWEGMVGPLTGDPHDIVKGCCAIARGLGFGRWTIGEHVPGKKLVLRTSSNYEAAHWLERFGVDVRSRAYFMQGAALAFMVLAQRVPWRSKPQLTPAFYDQLFRGEGIGYRITTPRCLTMGHEVTEVVIERM